MKAHEVKRVRRLCLGGEKQSLSPNPTKLTTIVRRCPRELLLGFRIFYIQVQSEDLLSIYTCSALCLELLTIEGNILTYFMVPLMAISLIDFYLGLCWLSVATEMQICRDFFFLLPFLPINSRAEEVHRRVHNQGSGHF